MKQKKRIIRIENIYAASISFLARFRKFFIACVVLLFGLPVFFLPSEIEGWDIYNDTIGNEYYQEEIRPTVDRWLGGSLRMFVRDVFEKSGYRSPEQTILHINAEMDHGHTLTQMDAIISEVEAFLQSTSGLDKFVTEVYSGQHAHISIFFSKEYEETSLPYQLKNKLIARSLDWGGVEWDIYGVGKGFSNSVGEDIPRFTVELRGYHYDEVGRQAEALAAKLLTHKRIQDVNTNEKKNYWEKKSNQYLLRFNRKYLSMNRTPLSELQEDIQQISKPSRPDTYLMLEGVSTPISIREQDGNSFSKYNLIQNPIASSRISNLASLKFESTTNSIRKEDRLYIRFLSFDYFGSHHFGSQFLDQKIEEMKIEMPAGFLVKKHDFNWNLDKVKRQYSLIFVLTICIYFVCAILFENLKQPLIIISTIPVSFIGLFLIFGIFDFYFDQGGYAAFLLLGGLVVNASIFVMSDFNNLKHIKNANKRLVRAIGAKIRPIVLTTLSSIFGLIPFLWEGEDEVFWFSLAIGTIGGLIFSLFSIFIFLPMIMWQSKKNESL